MKFFAKAASAILGGSLAVTTGSDLRKVTVAIPPEGARRVSAQSFEGVCDYKTLDQLVAMGIPEGQPGHVLENTGWIDEDTGEEHPMQVLGYRVEKLSVPTGIRLDDGSEFEITVFRYEHESCFSPNPERR